MRILAVSDDVVNWIYSPGLRARAEGVDLVVSCGDLPIWYLEFISSSIDAPCVMVKGNHDTHEVGEGGVIRDTAAGWLDLDSKHRQVAGLSMAGLQGCVRYKPDAPYQYEQQQQRLRAYRLFPSLFWRKLRNGRGIDLLVTHAPPYGIHNGLDRAHTGFTIFNSMMALFSPLLLLHGHQHRTYAPTQDTFTRSGATAVVNVHPYRFIDIEGVNITLGY
jgi:uncharacterized protein